MAVCVCVNLDNKQWKENVNAKLMHPNMTTFVLTLVGAETVKRVAQCRYVEAISDQNKFPINGNDFSAGAEDWGKCVVPHTDTTAGGRLI